MVNHLRSLTDDELITSRGPGEPVASQRLPHVSIRHDSVSVRFRPRIQGFRHALFPR
jgi:hypothetical protein